MFNTFKLLVRQRLFANSCVIWLLLCSACVSTVRSSASSPSMTRVSKSEVLRGQTAQQLASSQMSIETAYDILNRLSFGPTPRSAQELQVKGLAKWLSQQLRPVSIDDTEMEAVVAPYRKIIGRPYDVIMAFQKKQMSSIEGQSGSEERVGLKQNVRTVSVGTLLRNIVADHIGRQLYSRAQLNEVMVDFWFNHFNVHIRKRASKYAFSEYMHSTIRPHALGKFSDLLIAVAKSPAMLEYLDNANSMKTPKPGTKLAKRHRGINENYARELLELHTLGVNGGYNQQDIINVARILTGWTIARPSERTPPESVFTFLFRSGWHDRGTKVVLGKKYKGATDMREGVALLTNLARHPSTATRLAKKLCIKFLSDMPSRSCISRGVKAFQSSDGDIAETIHAILLNDEFITAAHERKKMKTPYEFYLSTLRVLGAKLTRRTRTLSVTMRLGQPLFHNRVPTGYAEQLDFWRIPAGIFERMKFARQLTRKKVKGFEVDFSIFDTILPASVSQKFFRAGESGTHQIVTIVSQRLFGRDIKSLHVAIDNALQVASLKGKQTNDKKKYMTAETGSTKEYKGVGKGALTRLTVSLALASPSFQQQ